MRRGQIGRRGSGWTGTLGAKQIMRIAAPGCAIDSRLGAALASVQPGARTGFLPPGPRTRFSGHRETKG